jgi:hypothetical protein
MLRTLKVTNRLPTNKAACSHSRRLLLPTFTNRPSVRNKWFASPQHPSILRRATTAMSKPRPTNTVTGSCLCGAVQYTCTGSDRGAVLCHCQNCQKGSGSAFAYNYRFLKAKLTFTKGEDMVKEYADKATRTGNTLYRHFCKECGSPIYLRNSAFEGLVVLHTGLMDRTPNGTPSAELFGENRKDWFGGVGKTKI